MTRYDEMDAFELRTELDVWRDKALTYAREYRAASQSSDLGWQLGMGVALDQALSQVRRLEALLRLGVAA